VKALMLEDVQTLRVRDIPEPELKPGGAVVRVKANGVCRSDWHAWTGHQPRTFPWVLGHEMTGVVEQVAEGVTEFAVGDRVIVPFAGACGTCRWCRLGENNLCENIAVPGKTYFGGMGELVSVPGVARNLVPLPDSVTFTEGAALGCRFITAYHGVIDRGRVAPGEWVAVFGCGGIGLSAINSAAAAGARVIGVDINPGNLDLASKVGAGITINSKETDAVEAIQEITKGGADVAVDALGITDTCTAGILSLRKQGRHVQIGVTTQREAGYISVPIDVIVYKELQLIGSLGMQTHRFGSVLGMVSEGLLKPGSTINREIGLGEVNDVFEAMTRSENTGTFVITDYS
jgi:D-arabinose 1-dehydrogenase-like Zn-dependent alcohol dehydrogenase